jgi:uncharacterized protein YbjT (DUF2867 family)
MSEKKIIAVVGATGAQGGGLVQAILDDVQGGFAVRAITRNADSTKAKALAERGAQVAAADLDDEASLVKALAGAHGAYFVTNFWEHFSPDKEQAQARNLAAAARHAGLAHVIWSTLEDTRRWVPLSDARMPTLMGRYKVPHFDAKGEADAYFRDAGVPTTFLLTSFYWDNLIHFGMGPKPTGDGRLAFTLPIGEAKMPGISAEDIGKCAYGIFRKGTEAIGRTIGIAGEHLTGGQMAASMSRALGREVVFNAVSPAQYRGFGFPGAEDLGNMFQFYAEFDEYFCGARSVELSRALNPQLQSFADWLARNAGRIPLA